MRGSKNNLPVLPFPAPLPVLPLSHFISMRPLPFSFYQLTVLGGPGTFTILPIYHIMATIGFYHSSACYRFIAPNAFTNLPLLPY